MSTFHSLTYEKAIKYSDFIQYKFQERIWTECFRASSCESLQFYLKIFPAGEDEPNYTSLFLYCKPTKPINIHYNLYIKDFNGNKFSSEWTTEFNEEHKAWGKRKMSVYPKLNNVNDDSEFIFGVSLDFELPKNWSNTVVIFNDDEKKISIPKTMAERMINAFENEIGYDVIFNVQNEKIKAHQSIVGICSPMLMAIFGKQNSFEFHPIVVNILNFDSNIIKHAIRYCYTDKLEKMTVDTLFKIYDFSMSYQIEDLKNYVYNSIMEILNTENAVKIANFGEEIDDSKMQKIANEFISKNLKQVRSFEESFANLSFENCKEILKLV